jgi:hypothetical protein
MSYGLSKTRILNGLQCPKRLWLEVHRPELAEYSKLSAQFIQAGNEVHKAYRELIPDGILVEHVDDLNAALEQTRLILSESAGAPVFEGAFEHTGVLVRADLIFPVSTGSRLVELKAAGSVKDYHIQDCAIQTWVIEGAGIPIKTVELAVIDTSFVYPGGGDYRGLFRHEDVTESVRILIPQVAGWVRECRKVLESAMPVVGIGDHCRAPYACPLLEHCSVEGPAYPVTCLPYGRNVAEELMAEGILDIRDIPEGKLSNSTHERVHRVTKSGKAEIVPSVVAVLNQFPYPRYYLDFETIAFAVPRWRGTRPYQQIPFQWSCHVEHADGSIEHKWFLDTSGEAPMRAVAESLVSNLGDSGTIFMYSPFEKTRISELAFMFPNLAGRLDSLAKRLVDLYPIVKDHYYHPDMMGSWSLKSVTACIAPEMSYEKLQEVTDGMAAQRAYLEIIMPGTDNVRRENLRNKLFEYCKLDTIAMIRITRLLQGH